MRTARFERFSIAYEMPARTPSAKCAGGVRVTRSVDRGGPRIASAMVAIASAAARMIASGMKSATPGEVARSSAIAASVQRNRGVNQAGSQMRPSTALHFDSLCSLSVASLRMTPGVARSG
jgi:hypothetical protein